MVIRIVLTLIFIIIGFLNVKRSLIKEINDNPYIKKVQKNKLQNFLVSTIPYTLFKIAVIYVILMVLSVMFLQSKCRVPILIETYNYDTLLEDYKENNKKNVTYMYEFDGKNYKIRDVDKVIINNDFSNYIELYELKSDNNIINILLYGMFERQIIIYEVD